MKSRDRKTIEPEDLLHLGQLASLLNQTVRGSVGKVLVGERRLRIGSGTGAVGNSEGWLKSIRSSYTPRCVRISPSQFHRDGGSGKAPMLSA